MNKYSYSFPNHRILSKTEEQQLFQIYNKPDTSKRMRDNIREKIITHNMKFASRCANLYVKKCPHVHPDDLKGYAMMGLIDSVDRFDHTIGVKFTSFAVWWIKNYINRNVECNESLVRYPANIHQQLQKAVNKKEFTDEVVTKFETIKGGLSMDQPIENGDGATVGDLMFDESIVDMIEVLDSLNISDKIAEAINSLESDEQEVIKEAFGFATGDKKCIREISESTLISEDKIRGIRLKGINKLKKRLRSIR